VLKLRPHHIIDIIRDYGENDMFSPHPYGHAYHIIAEIIVKNINQSIQLVSCADDICTPCIHLQSNNLCNDILLNHPYSKSKQEYNDYLDNSILEFLSLEKGIELTIYFKELSFLIKFILIQKKLLTKGKLLFWTDC
jgi:hypothetical protein